MNILCFTMGLTGALDPEVFQWGHKHELSNISFFFYRYIKAMTVETKQMVTLC